MSSELKQPFFSVLIPSYNRPEDIARNIDSILADPFKDVEIVISDDKSPRAEEVRQAVDPYLSLDNVRFFEQPENLREPTNKNFLIEQARGQYSIILGDDDRFFANALTTLKGYIDRNPDYELYCFGYEIVDEHDRTIVSRQSPTKFEISQHEPQVMNQMFCADMLPLWLFHPNTFCCKNGVEKEMRYHTDVGIGEDLYFIFDFLIRRKKMLVLPETIFYWRKIQDLNSGKQINQSLALLSDYAARKLMYDKFQQDSTLPAELSQFMQSKEYRVRFLYNSIIADRRLTPDRYTKAGMSELLMSDEMLEEFLDYAQPDKLDAIRKNHHSQHLRHFFKLVGYKGIVSVLKLVYQRFANKRHIRRLKANNVS